MYPRVLLGNVVLLLNVVLRVHAVILGNDLGFGRWSLDELTYSVEKYPERTLHPKILPSMMKKHVDDCMKNAVEVWAKDAPIEFRRIQPGEDADIKVFFYSGDHGDSYAFDGSGGEVAHTFYPNKHKKGHIHVDDEEPWSPHGRNLEWTLAHEVGHSLGIPHQMKPSLMADGYRGYKNTPVLTDIDKWALALIYGKRR